MPINTILAYVMLVTGERCTESSNSSEPLGHSSSAVAIDVCIRYSLRKLYLNAPATAAGAAQTTVCWSGSTLARPNSS
jgi:hypothetical protein